MWVLGDLAEVMFLISGKAGISAQVFLINGKAEIYDPMARARCSLFMALTCDDRG